MAAGGVPLMSSFPIWEPISTPCNTCIMTSEPSCKYLESKSMSMSMSVSLRKVVSKSKKKKNYRNNNNRKKHRNGTIRQSDKQIDRQI